MNKFDVTLSRIAKSLGVEPQMLGRYLFEELDPMKRAMLIEPRWTKLEQLMTHGGTGVFFCLIEKLSRPAQRPRTTSDYVGRMLEGVYRAATARGYSTLYYCTHQDLATPEYFQNLLTKHPTAGLLTLIPHMAQLVAEVCAGMERACLLIDFKSDTKLPVHVLNFDSFSPVRELTRQLIELGHQRIAFITGKLNYQSAVDRLDGYKAALEEVGIPIDPDLIAEGNFEMELGHDIGLEFLNMAERPTAIVCSNDLTALGVYDAVHEAGMTIPDDISVVGFDDIPIAPNINPPLTTVRQSMTEMAATATTLLIDAIEGNSEGYVHLHPLEIIVRESMGRVPRLE